MSSVRSFLFALVGDGNWGATNPTNQLRFLCLLCPLGTLAARIWLYQVVPTFSSLFLVSDIFSVVGSIFFFKRYAKYSKEGGQIPF